MRQVFSMASMVAATLGMATSPGLMSDILNPVRTRKHTRITGRTRIPMHGLAYEVMLGERRRDTGKDVTFYDSGKPYSKRRARRLRGKARG